MLKKVMVVGVRHTAAVALLSLVGCIKMEKRCTH